MIHDDSEVAGWSHDAVKDWGFACLLNAPFPICILLADTLDVRLHYGSHYGAIPHWMGALAAVAVIFAAGIYFAGRESRIFTRVIDGAYILAVAQLFPAIQFATFTGGVGIWNFVSSRAGIRSDRLPFLESYVVLLGFGQLSLIVSFALGCVYRKPRGYPRWLRPWNHDFDRINDTLTRR